MPVSNLREESAGERRRHPSAVTRCLYAGLFAAALAAAPALAQRTVLKPGTNMFTPDQDVQIGAQNAAQVEQQYEVVHDPQITAYLNRLGQSLAVKAPGPKFNYTFKLVNDKAVNAFALPGGYLFVNRGLIEAADNEAQLAGVMGHEIGHAALRHGTNQATKAAYTQQALGIVGALVGGMGNSATQLVTQLGMSFGPQSILLKFSRDAERQADLVGTQILYDNGYDPRAMAQFFEKLGAETKGGRPPEFFSTHPNPENRSVKVTDEINRLGGLPPNARTDSAEFRRIKAMVAALPQPSGAKGGAATASKGGKPAAPATQMQAFDGKLMQMQFPQNWKAYGGEDAELGGVTFAPEGGVVQGSDGKGALAYGMIVGVYQAADQRGNRLPLEQALDQFVRATQQSNPKLKVDNRKQKVTIDGQPGLVVNFENTSPSVGRELGRMVAVGHAQGLLYFVSVAPQADFEAYDHALKAALGSVKFRR